MSLRAMQTSGNSIGTREVKRLGGECGGQKVNRNRLSGLMRSVLRHVRECEGIERGELSEHILGLERRYRGYFVDPCMKPKEKLDYERRHHRAQPVLTRTLKRPEKRGLVNLVRGGKYVKRVYLTEEGRMVAENLRRARR